MIRFITDILDVKNLLGMQRTPIPMPEYPANETVLRFPGNTAEFILYGGSYTVSYTYNGTIYTNNYTGSNTFNLSTDVGTDIIIIGATDVNVAIGSCTFAVLGSSVTYYADNGTVQTIDIRNVGIFVIGGGVITGSGIKTLYVHATTTNRQSASNTFINRSVNTNGVLWIDPTEAYAASVITTAQTKGWTVYDL